ncbi:restriction endonuclease [Pseudomonas sp. gcc21]|uniref:EcoRII N-terminal effector-binding domain-containing protein n=1 Tax=Pseudomonas sp. gcc21 TaxID=2726989 RepID=UPI001451C98A|nr:EcoRII N-terminal effector-binding domain-containing protein [Pseudomonas sp. gcc21]QJD59972.1 restriction endonuclease [Pseudomonas sp. gcc21]
MKKLSFRKLLSANDVGATGGHQAGVLIPKGETELLRLLPHLDPSIKNPSIMIDFFDENDNSNRFRFVYYNNKLHDDTGTRNEYRITGMTAWFREKNAQAGDFIEISGVPKTNQYFMKIVSEEIKVNENEPAKIQLRGWRRVY